jgi:hypothetical protein
MRQQGRPEFCREAAADAGCIHEIAAAVVPDQDRIDRAAVWNVAADYELLLR